MGKTFVIAAIALTAILGVKLTWEKSRADMTSGDVSTISNGERIDLLDYVPDSGIVIVEFTADW